MGSDGVISVNSQSAPGALYRRNAITGDDVILGSGITTQSSYQLAGGPDVLVLANSAYDAITPVASSRFFGQEVIFDVSSGPIKSIYPSTSAPFASKYQTNRPQISMSLALVNSGAFAYYISPSTISTTLDLPLRASYFEHKFYDSTTDPFPDDDPDDPDPDDPPGIVYDEAKWRVKDLFGATTPGEMVCLDADIIINGLPLNQIDSNGVLWLCTGIEGWWTTSEAASPDLPRGELDGSFDGHGRYSARALTVNGIFLPPGRDYVRAARDRLFRAINLTREDGYLRTLDDQFARESRVWLSGRPEIETVNQKGRTEFSIGFVAPDPTKYELVNEDDSINYRVSQTVLSNITAGRTYNKTYAFSYNWDPANPTGDITVTNYGNYDVPAKFIITGPVASGAEIINLTTGASFELAAAIGLNQSLTVDTGPRTVLFEESPNSRAKLTVGSDWIMIAPGVNRISFLGTNTGGVGDAPPRLVVQWRSGWIG
jgi:hypothetical protein